MNINSLKNIIEYDEINHKCIFIERNNRKIIDIMNYCEVFPEQYKLISQDKNFAMFEKSIILNSKMKIRLNEYLQNKSKS